MAKKISKERELKKVIKEQQKVIDVLSNKEIVEGFKSALNDLKRGDYTILTK